VATVRGSGVVGRIGRFASFSVGVLIGERIFGSRNPGAPQPTVADVWRAEVGAIEAEVARRNDVRIATVVRRIVIR
jgi:hypothetical protein